MHICSFVLIYKLSYQTELEGSTMHDKVTIEVDRLHWYCRSCRLKNKHVVSIDAHLQSCHMDLLSCISDASLDSAPNFDADHFSEGDCDLYGESDDLRTDLYEDSTDKRSDEDLSDSVPSPVIVKRKPTAHCRRKSRAEAKKSQKKGNGRGLMLRSGDVIYAEPSQEMLSLRLKRNRHSLCRLTRQQMENQSERLKSVSSKGKTNSQTAKETAGRKRKMPLVDSGSTDTHEMKDGASKENEQTSADKADTVVEASVPKRKRGRPKSSVKPKDTGRKKLKAVDREMKKYCWGGKPVKRSQEVAKQEMEGVRICYVSSEQSKQSESSSGAAMLMTINSASLSSVQLNGGLKSEDGCNVLDSGRLKNDDRPTTGESSDMAVEASSLVHKKHTEVMQGSIREAIVLGESCKHENVTISHTSSALQVCNANDHSAHQIDLQSTAGSNILKETDSVPQTTLVAHGNVCPPRLLMSISGHDSSSAVTLVQVPLSKNVSYPGDSFKHTSNSCNQQHATKVSETLEVKLDSSLEEQYQNVGSGECIKSRTPNFSFSRTKRPACSEKSSTSKVHECAVCQAKFSSGEYLADHFFKMSSHEQAECQSCRRVFHDTYSLNFHVFEDHERRFKPFCFTCEDKFQNMAAFEKHLYKHRYNIDPKLMNMEYHLCHICQTDIPCRFETLRKHYNKHRKTVCLECYVRSELVLLPDSASVQEHRKIHSHFCNVCIQDFSSADLLNDHYPCKPVSVHKEDGQGMLCDRCSQWCPNKALATLHHKEHRLEGMRKWREEKWAVGIACVHCDKILSNKRNLERHIANLHSNSRSYSFHCEYCGKGVDSKNILKDHIAVNHLGIKRYCCEYCDQRFSSSTTLRRHTLKEHATDKQYTCDECGEKFCEKVKLTRHMYIHTGSARFMCEQCGKGFHSRSEFKKHLAIHEDKRRFACLGCGQEYKRKEHLKRHIQKCSKSVHSGAQSDMGMGLPHQ